MFALDIVMPYYGDPALLLRAVESVRGLRDTDWRLTIVEDLHPKGPQTEREIAAFGDGRVRYLRNPENLGVARNTFKCLRLAEREHFVLMDYDDVMLPNYGTAVRDLLARSPDAVIAQPGIEVIDEEDRPYLPLPDRIKAMVGPVNKDVEISGERAADSLLRGNWTYAPAVCYRLDAARRLEYRPEGAKSTHDLARLVDLMMLGGSLAVGSEIAFRYRRHRHSNSSADARSGERFEQERDYYRKIADELRAHGWRRAERTARARLFSRFNALVQLPGAVRQRQGGAVKALVGHVVG